jgi:hypothetical protein
VIASYVALASATAVLNYRLVDMRAPLPQVATLVVVLALLLLVPYAHDRLSYLPFLAVRCVVLGGYAIAILAVVDPERLALLARRLNPVHAEPLDGKRNVRVP